MIQYIKILEKKLSSKTHPSASSFDQKFADEYIASGTNINTLQNLTEIKFPEDGNHQSKDNLMNIIYLQAETLEKKYIFHLLNGSNKICLI